MKKLKASQDN